MRPRGPGNEDEAGPELQPRTQGLLRAKALVNAGHVTTKYSQNLGVFLYIIKTPIGSQGE